MFVRWMQEIPSSGFVVTLNETAKRWIQPLARNVSEEKESET
jgi:hypothetical protein